MSPTPDDDRLNELRLRALLATLILVADGFRWPGSDGLTVDDLLRAYPALARQGRVPGPEELCRRHPELARALADFFDPARPSPR